MAAPLRFLVLGMTLSFSWGNGHATTYRSLLAALAARGHEVHFLERDVPWYALRRDCVDPPGIRLDFYESLQDLQDRFSRSVRDADVVIVGSFLAQGIEVGDWVLQEARNLTAFYDIDTLATIGRLLRRDETLQVLQSRFGSPRAVVLYGSADPEAYQPSADPSRWDLGYMGTCSADRQAPLTRLLLDVARSCPDGRFAVAGPQYASEIVWPSNVQRIESLSPPDHRGLYGRQRCTLNLTRADMIAAGWSPSVRLFEAAACATPIISDRWVGIETLFEPDTEIVLASTTYEVIGALRRLDEPARRAMGDRARRRALGEQTAAHRAEQLEHYVVTSRSQGRLRVGTTGSTHPNGR